MPYFGVTPAAEYTSKDLNGSELILDADADTTITADTDDQIDIRIAGADDFQFTANTFTAQSGSTIAAQALTATTVNATGLVTAGAKVDLNGTELILDADADTSITADTDDQIDIRIAGADDFQFTANTFTALSGSTVAIASGATIANSGTATGFGFASGDVILADDGSAGAPGLAFADDTDHGFFRTSDKLGYSVGGSERIRFDGKLILVGDTANSNNAIGITLNQDTQDDSILALKSSDISHGMTDYAEADTYLYFSKFNATGGGGAIYGLGEDNTGLTLVGLYPDTDATKSGSGHAPMEFDVKKKSGTGAGAPSSNDNLYTFEADGTVKVLFDMEGDIYHDSDVVTAYDTHDDAQLIRSIDLSKSENNSRGVIESKFDKFISYNHENLADLGLVGRESDGTPNYFVNLTGMSRLHNGAIWQQYEKHENLLNAVYELAVEAVGEDKANEILDKNDIKLLSENKLLN